MTLTFAQAIGELANGKTIEIVGQRETDRIVYKTNGNNIMVNSYGSDGNWVRASFTVSEVMGQWQIVPDEGCKYKELPFVKSHHTHVCPYCGLRKEPADSSCAYCEGNVHPKPEKIEPYYWGNSLSAIKDAAVQYSFVRLTNYMDELVSAINDMRSTKPEATCPHGNMVGYGYWCQKCADKATNRC